MKNIPHRAAYLIRRYPQWIFLFIIVSMQMAMLAVIGLDAPFWGDEAHLVATIRYFGQNLKIGVIADYNQVTGPLFYIIYALWGKLSSFDIAHLRILNILFSLATFSLLFRLYAATLSNGKTALLTACLVLLNPYMWGLSFFVFTDISTLCFVVLMGLAVYRQNPWLLFGSTAAALLTRQYCVFLVAAAGGYELVHWARGDRRRRLNLCALVCACLPLLGLMFVWKGIAPPSGIKQWVLTDGKFYHFSYLTTYITFMALYSLPALFWVRRQLFYRPKLLPACLVLSGWYLFFPVGPSYTAMMQIQLDTVGLMHRLIRKILPVPFMESLLLFGLFWCGLVVLANIILHDVKRFQKGIWDYGHFLTLIVICFLLIMPLSYQLWEKYLVIVLPFLLLRLAMWRNQTEFHPSHPG